ncbi:hypothetical protein N2152v2_009975 [Parachlorella kessleri]
MPLTRPVTLSWHRPLRHPTVPTQLSGDAGACRKLRPTINTYGRNQACGSSSPVSHGRSGRASAVVAAAQPQPDSSSSSSTAQPCPLHACLLLYGITDLAAFSAPKHLALSQEEVDRNVEPKLAALAAEGLSPKQMAQLLGQEPYSPLPCSYKDTFQPNLQVLRDIAAHMQYRPHPKTPQLTALGKVLAASSISAARYLARDPKKVQELLQCLERDLGIGLKQLAACNSLFQCLFVSGSSAQAAIAMLLEKGVPVQQVARMALAHPTLLKRSATALAANLAALEELLDLDAAAALQLAVGQPNLFSYDIKARLPPLLHFLDTYMGVEGAGRKLVRAQPTLGTLTAAAAERSIDSLAARGYSQKQIQGMINGTPILIMLNLDSPLQRQKLDWIERVSPWKLEDFLSVPVYLTYSTQRLAARLALLRECGLQLPSTPSRLINPSSATFLAAVRKLLAGLGRELPWASWAEWEEAWLGTKEGREWGFPPLKE